MFNDFRIILVLINNYKKKAEVIMDKEKTRKFLENKKKNYPAIYH